MHKRSPDHNVRLLTLVLWIPAFSFLLPYGIIAHKICPSLGIAPMTISALIAVMHIYGMAKSRIVNFIFDIFVALFLLGTLIPGWITLADGNSWVNYTNTGDTMVGTYGTVPLMVNFIIHTYYGFRELYVAWTTPSKKCPHCNKAYIAVSADDTDDPAMVERDSNDSKESFHSSQGHITLNEDHPFQSSSKEPRPSTDDETARLV
ncbi:hypothetical protein LTR56_003200 [Elasticomyces elasticus]|nr:hypothetical protein LTR22_010733 [Elasticomyces elasticus]KAK3656068.1 hypothetical protein LTR56_003200 [Elasticomyces elasticus]KAK4920869.1 hypothetical protein LTR49_011591 [Elasticomyces elasticus]KAK5759614.1 hypothetical protein LTS12_010307 [Elasticomyces elasticus]